MRLRGTSRTRHFELLTSNQLLDAIIGIIDVDKVLAELTIHEKIKLLAGQDTWCTFAIERLNIPSIRTTDRPHGARGVSFFNGPPGMLLPSATAIGATFDRDLIAVVGKMLGRETREKGCQVLLAPTVCLQRSPLIGRGFKAFGEDPWLSGTLASDYINVKEATLDVAVKNLLNLTNKVRPSLEPVLSLTAGNSPKKGELCRKVAAESIVLLKNEKGILPLDTKLGGKTYALIGLGALYPAVSGGGSADLIPYYVSKPLDALKELVRAENVTATIGCYGHLFTPLLSSSVTVPGTD
ncbi:hypothetical protein N7499_013342 [Penicillium canescens]|nr:hypothetical protein N7499_013342 [Penicillium canescens]